MQQSASSETSAPLLAMRAIGKRFGGVAALDNVSLTVGAGEVVALIGENGAGKSTLMKILGGIYTPDAGQIVIAGAQMTFRAPRDAADRGIAFIHQELSVLENLDVAANLFLGHEPTNGGALRLLDERSMKAQANDLLRRVGLSVSPATAVASLSLAQRQLVEIARALGQNARLLIMDEPTSSLTPTETDRLLEVVRELRAQGVSVIYISHRLHEIEQVADRVVALRDGKNAGELEKGEIAHSAMVRLMVGRDLSRDDDAATSVRTNPSESPRLAVHDLRTVRYPQQKISFAIQPGEILGFAGLVGAGRTEIALALFGVVPMVGGSIAINGETVALRTPNDAIARGLYLVPEDRRRTGLILPFPIRANVTLPRLRRFAMPGGWIRRKAEDAAAADVLTQLHIRAGAMRDGAGVSALLENAAGTLSGGNQQKVVLAKWLALAPQILVFDEPTRGVDVGAKTEIYALIRALAAGGTAILLISSEMEEVMRLADRIAVLHEGALTGILPRAEFSEEAIMRLAVGAIDKEAQIATVSNT